MKSDARSPWPTLIVIAATWGTAFLFIKLAVGGEAGMPPFALAAARGGLAGLGLAAYLASARRRVAWRGRWPHMAALGLLNGIAPNTLTAVALRHLDSAPAAMLQASTPLFVALLAVVALPGERPRPRALAGVALGFAGVFLIADPQAVLAGRAGATGVLAMLGASLCYAAASVWVRRFRPGEPAGLAFGQQIFAAAPAVVLSLILEPRTAFAIGAGGWAALIGLGWIATALPMVLYFGLVGRIPAAQAAIVQFLLPVAATIYGVTILGEHLSWIAVVGGTIVLLGVRLSLDNGK